MDTAFITLMQNAPAAGAIIFVVVYFLRSIDKIITQFQQMLADEKKSQKEMNEYWRGIFDSQREALNLIAAHMKQLSDGIVQHDGWERQQSSVIIEKLDRLQDGNDGLLQWQKDTTTRKLRTIKKQ